MYINVQSKVKVNLQYLISAMFTGAMHVSTNIFKVQIYIYFKQFTSHLIIDIK